MPIEKHSAPHLAGNRYHVAGGLRSAEILLLQRAIASYATAYQRQKGDAKTAHEKAEIDLYIKAADELSSRLRYELVQLPFDMEAKDGKQEG